MRLSRTCVTVAGLTLAGVALPCAALASNLKKKLKEEKR